MKFLIDLLPLVAFAVVYYCYDIYVATAVFMAATLLQLLLLKCRGDGIQMMHWMSLFVAIVFGSLTLLLHDPIFIKWKPSIVYWGLALLLWISEFRNKSILVKFIASHTKEVQLSKSQTRRMTQVWVGFFSAMGILNLLIAYLFSETFWVNFKLYGFTALFFVFLVFQSLILAKTIKKS